MSTRRTGRERHSRLTSTWPDTVAVQARLTGARLRDAWGNLLGRFPWQWFVTLTFDPTRVFPVSSAVVEREAIWWGGMVARMLRLPMLSDTLTRYQPCAGSKVVVPLWPDTPARGQRGWEK
jgi:hypothetical protein